MQKKIWIREATKHKGALRKNLEIPTGTKITKDKLEAASKRPGKIGSEARLALTLEKLRKLRG